MEIVGTKVGVFLAIVFSLGHRSRAGVIFLDEEAFHEHGDSLSPGLPSRSYLHFHGPVEGPVLEVKVPSRTNPEDRSNHLLGGELREHSYALDFVARPKYEFSYGVADQETGDFHGQQEIRDGSSVSGQYSVKEPGGGVRVVSYRADRDGFHAVVQTSGKNEHSASLYSGQGQVRIQDEQVAMQQEQQVQDYVASYAANDDQ